MATYPVELKRIPHQFPTWYCPCGFIASAMTLGRLGLLFRDHVARVHNDYAPTD